MGFCSSARLSETLRCQEKKKGTFYFTRVVATVNFCSCQEHPEHPEVALFTMS